MTTRVISHPICDPSQKSCSLKIPKNRNRVSRQLFGPADGEETRKFLQDEMNVDRVLASQRWDFDFLKERPKQHSDAKYEWMKVSITFAPRRPSKPSPEPDNTELYAMPLPIRVEDEQKLTQPEAEKDDRDYNKKDKMTSKQSQITDFMSIRKRKPSDSNAKKTTQSVIPAKISKHDNITS